MSGPAGTYGVLGAGTIAEAIVTGLCAEEATPPDVVVSPRGRARSAALAARFGSVRVAPDNQAVVDASDTVLICVRPPQAAEVLRPLRWRRGQSVVSVVAGLPIAALADCVGPVTDIARAIPLPAVARRGAPTPVHPPTAAACRLFDGLGGALPIEDVHAFEAMSAVTGTLAAHFRLLDVMSRWLAAQGASQEAATRYVASTYASLGRSLEADPVDLAAMAAEYATPGGLNERFAAMLDDAELFSVVERSLDRLLEGLEGR